MPIRKDLRHFYGPVWRQETRPQILARARDKCECCKVPNHTEVFRASGMWRHIAVGAVWHRANGKVTTFQPATDHRVRIVLTIAHLNHISGDDRADNLKAMCQWCHLDYDRRHHQRSRATRKDKARPLLQLLDPEQEHQSPQP